MCSKDIVLLQYMVGYQACCATANSLIFFADGSRLADLQVTNLVGSMHDYMPVYISVLMPMLSLLQG